MQSPSPYTAVTLIIILLLLPSTLGCISFDPEEDDDNDQYVSGFELEFLKNSVPLMYELNEPTIEEKPKINSSTPKRVSNIIAIWYFEKNVIYKDFGGVIKISIENNWTSGIYVYRIGILPSWYSSVPRKDAGEFADAGVYIYPGEKKDVGIIYFSGPAKTGRYNYHISFSAYSQNDDGSWNDCGPQDASEKSNDVIAMPNTVEYEQHYNIKQYYKKINSVVDPTNARIYNLSHELASNYSGKYNIFQVCALFEYVNSNIKYFSDPSNTENYWCTPEQTLLYGGDCEDHSTLIASLIISLGGAVRMYMTDSHAFLGLYIGDRSNIDALTSAIRSYYRTDLQLFYFDDDLGSWLIVDTVGSIYLGGLPLGAAPTVDNDDLDNNSGKINMSWGFTETESLYIIDIKP